MTIVELLAAHSAAENDVKERPFGSVTERAHLLRWRRDIRIATIGANVNQRFYAETHGLPLPTPVFADNEGGIYHVAFADNRACVMPEPGLRCTESISKLESLNAMFDGIDAIPYGASVNMRLIRPAIVERWMGQYKVVCKGELSAAPSFGNSLE